MDEQKRIDWIDIYRGILIILVVVGHATGKFNAIIYQFHMAAFFFISGYTSKLDKKGFIEFATNKIFTLLLPLFSAVIVGIGINSLINFTGYFSKLFNFEYMNVKQALIEFIESGHVYVQFLGAIWFLIVLFGVSILQDVLICVNNKRINILYAIICIILYIYGYSMTKLSIRPHILFVPLDLVCIAQLYYAIGLIVSRCIDKLDLIDKNRMPHIIVLIAALGVQWWGKKNGIVMDFPSRNFNNFFVDAFVAIAGIYVVMYIAQLLSKCLKSVGFLVDLGRNSLGIMILHFLFFKIYFVGLFKLNLISSEDIRGVVLSDELGRRFWIGLTLFSIICSLTVWHMMKHVKVCSFLMGNSKKTYLLISDRIEAMGIIQVLEKKGRQIIKKYSEKLDIFVTWIVSYKWCVLLLAMGICCVCIPLYQQGIMCNDELQSRYWAMQGGKSFYSHYLQIHIEKGRAISKYIDSFTMWLGFLGAKTNYTYKIVQILSILAVSVLFSVFINKLFRNKKFAIMCGIMIVVCLPITFEHTAPNAFVTKYNVPLCLLLISLCVFCDYIATRKQSQIAVSMVLFFIAQTNYEAFITYTILYIMITVGLTGIKNFKQNLTLYLAPIGSAAIFLFCYLVSRIIFPSNYSGNQIVFESLSSTISILKQLFMTSLPGYYLFCAKYKGLFTSYADLGLFSYVRVLLVILSLLPIFIVLMRNAKQFSDVKSIIGKIFVLLCGIVYIIAPTLPISVSKMYQGNVNENSFMALPISFFTYIAAIFVICYIIWNFTELFGRNACIAVAVVLLVVITKIQLMNDVFATEQKMNFDRLCNIENVLATDVVAYLDGGTLYAPDLYKRQNTLAIHDGYWTQYGNSIGRKITFERVNNEYCDGSIWICDDNIASIVCGEYIIVISPKKLNGGVAVKTGDNAYALVNCNQPVIDNNYFTYYFNYLDGDAISIDKDEFCGFIGNNLQTSKKIKGYYNDGWLSPSSEFKICTGDAGVLELKFYYPFEDYTSKEMIINISVDGKSANTIKIDEQTESVVIQNKKNTVVDINIDCNFMIEKNNDDIRDLSIVLVSMAGK